MSAKSPEFTLSPSSLTDALYESVRKRIINGDIGPGEKLTEARISSEYSVARPTAKACVERLTTVGLVRRSVHKTAVVPRLDRDEVIDLFFGRQTLECRAVSHLAEDKAVPTEATRSQGVMEAAVEDQDFERQVEADIAFHTALVDAVGSRRLSRMHGLIMGEVHLTMGQYQAHRTTHPSNVAREHAKILAAIRAGDPARAEKAMATHLRAAERRLVTYLDGPEA